MKSKSFLVILSVALMGLLGSCKKQETQVTYDGGTAPTLASNRAVNSVIPMDYYAGTSNAISFSWSNPNYRFSSGTASQTISYKLEIDTLGANFTNPRKRSFTFTGDLSKSFTQAEFNDVLYTGLQLKDSIQHTIEVRVTSYLGAEAAKLSSNTMTFKVTPFDIPPKVAPPASGKLFITGSASPLSWMGGGDPESNAVTAGQKFTQISPTKYQINSIALNGGQSFLLVPVYGDWGDKYGFTGGNNGNNTSGDEFKRGGGDIMAPAASGNYKIVVDFKLGTFTVTPV
jgi:hypothetical protein